MATVQRYFTRSAVKRANPPPPVKVVHSAHKHRHHHKRIKRSPIVFDIDDSDSDDDFEAPRNDNRQPKQVATTLSCPTDNAGELQVKLKAKTAELDSANALIRKLQDQLKIVNALLADITTTLTLERAQAGDHSIVKAELKKARTDIADLQASLSREKEIAGEMKARLEHQSSRSADAARMMEFGRAAELKAANATIAELQAEIAKAKSDVATLAIEVVAPPAVPAVPQIGVDLTNNDGARVTELEARIRYLTECVSVRDQTLERNKQKIRQLLPIVKVAPAAPLNTVMYMAAFNFYHCILLPMNNPAFPVKITGNAETDNKVSDAIKSYIRDKRLKAHPDKNLDNPKEAHVLFEHLVYIEKVLCNTKSRARYNQLLAQLVIRHRGAEVVFDPWTYVPHGGVYNTDISRMEEYLDGRCRTYAPSWNHVRGADQLPSYSSSTLSSCVFFEGVITKLE